MKTARYLLVFLLLAPLLAAQEPAAAPAEITSISVSAQSDGVRIEVNTSSGTLSPGSVHTTANSMLFDFPGVRYNKAARRIVVNRLGVKDVRIWLQNDGPLFTRVAVELDKPAKYSLSPEAKRIVLTINPAALNASAKPGNQKPAAVPTGRPSATTRAVGAVSTIFRRAPKEPTATEGTSEPTIPPAPQDQPKPPKTNNPETAESQTPAANSPAAASISNAPAEPVLKSERPAVAVQVPQPAAPQEVRPSVEPTREAAVPPTPPIPLTPPAASASTPSASEPNASTLAAAGAEVEPSTELPASSAVAAPVTPSTELSASATEAIVGGQPASDREMTKIPVTANSGVRTVFHVKHVQQDTAYIDGGRSAGLAEGMKLAVKDPLAEGASAEAIDTAPVMAELVVVGVAETSAVTEIRTPKRPVVPGDPAYLSDADVQTLVDKNALGTTRAYPAVISFTEGGDALDEEAHAEAPRPPLPSVNRAQGRIGLDYMSTTSVGGTQVSGHDLGLVLRADFTRIAGTYWNLSGYWRGRLDSQSSASQSTLQDLINRTYHLSLTYDNPNSHWVAGFGRLYLPWANSLDTIDGGYFGRRLTKDVIAGVFAGSTPDPTSWNFNPDRRLGGVFINFTGGDFDRFHYSSTTGAGVDLLKWQIDRPFVFFENSASFKRTFSIYHSLQADSPSGNPAVSAPGAGIGMSLLTVRWTPISRVQLDMNHTYFREVPTFDPQLVGTGLLDKYLFQGVSAGVRVEIVRQIAVYTELGRSARSGDSQSSLNQMYGVTFGKVPWVNVRADVHYSRFNSSFGNGTYRAVSLSRTLGERLNVSILAGDQAYTSTLAGNQDAKFLTALVDATVGARLFTQGGFTVYRSQQQSYNQWYFTLGYRFDSKSSKVRK